MRKYWIGTSYVKTTLGIVAGCVIADLLFGLDRELDWLDLWTVCTLVLGCATAALCLTRPVGLLKAFWVEAGVIYEKHVLTHRVRNMPLDAQHAMRRRETLRTTWLIMTDGDAVPVSMKQAKALYRAEKAMLIPVEGPLKEELDAIVAKAPYIE